jgi:hypothetical protein
VSRDLTRMPLLSKVREISMVFSVRVKLSRCSHAGAKEEMTYSSYSFLTSALNGGEWSESRPGRALPTVPIVQKAGWASKLVWTQRLEEKSFASAGIKPRSCIVQSDTILTEI